jgi:hypothetical protein
MARAGLLETMARADLEDLVVEVGRWYRPGALDRATADDPAWRQALDRTEEEVGALYASLCDADETLGRWRLALAELRRLWERLGRTPALEEEPAGPPVLREVA